MPRLLSFICVALVMSAGIFAVAPILNAGTSGSGLYATHKPIYIDENGEFNSTNGVVSGSGTKADPHIIDGWEFLFNGSGTAISVSDTTVYFVIRNVHVKGASIGISLSNVSHGAIKQSMVESCSGGIRISYSENCRVEDTTLQANGIAIILFYSEDTKLDGITYIDNDTKVFETKAPWLETWLGTAVCIAVLVPLAVIVLLIVYFRMRPPKDFRARPPPDTNPEDKH